MALTSLAVIFYFNFNPAIKVPIFVRIIAPVLAILGLGFVLILSFANIDVITGSSGASIFAIALMVGLPLIGALLSLRNTNSAGIPEQ
jgi:branched-subunit amino acid transport protein AzlD